MVSKILQCREAAIAIAELLHAGIMEPVDVAKVYSLEIVLMRQRQQRIEE